MSQDIFCTLQAHGCVRNWLGQQTVARLLEFTQKQRNSFRQTHIWNRDTGEAEIDLSIRQSSQIELSGDLRNEIESHFRSAAPDMCRQLGSTPLPAPEAPQNTTYGCSTGDEVFSLRHYFPHALVKGIDINPANIAVCRRRLRAAPDTGISFETAATTKAEPSNAYDAIFAMAVLRHGSLGLPGVTRCDHLIRFEEFARAVADFERCLKPGGLLIIRPQ